MPATRTRISSEQAELVTQRLKKEELVETVLTTSKEEETNEEKQLQELEESKEPEKDEQENLNSQEIKENGELNHGQKRKTDEDESSTDSIPEKKTKITELNDTKELQPTLQSST